MWFAAVACQAEDPVIRQWPLVTSENTAHMPAKKCVTLLVPVSFVFMELLEKLLCIVCHFVGYL